MSISIATNVKVKGIKYQVVVSGGDTMQPKSITEDMKVIITQLKKK